jgi:hypothetical protein
MNDHDQPILGLKIFLKTCSSTGRPIFMENFKYMAYVFIALKCYKILLMYFQIACANGSLYIRSVLLGVLVWYPSIETLLNLLVLSSADPTFVVQSALQPAFSTKIQRSLPLRNAVLLVRSSNDPRLLSFIDYTTSGTLFSFFNQRIKDSLA